MSRGRKPVRLMIMSYGKTMDEDEFANTRDLLYDEVYKVDRKNYVV